MDLKIFYQKVREVETQLADDPALVVSAETSDGGRAGVVSEVPRRVAARMIVEGKARIADARESSEYRRRAEEALRKSEEDARARRVQVTVISEADLRSLRSKDRQKG